MRPRHLPSRHVAAADLEELERGVAYPVELGFEGWEVIYRERPCDRHLIDRTQKLLDRFNWPVSMVSSSQSHSVFGEAEQQQAVGT